MILQGIFVLSVVQLTVLADFSVRLESGDIATFMVDEDSPQGLSGSQGVIIFAKVVSIPKDYVFKIENKVALKFVVPEKEAEIRREQNALDIIRTRGSEELKERVVVAEKFLGTALDFPDRENHFVLIMEPLGKNLFQVCDEEQLSDEEQEAIYNQLCFTFEQLKLLGIAHGDVKPDNIVLKKSNKVGDGIKLIDFGLAVVEGSDFTKCAGDPIYVSPIQLIKQRPANYDDVAVSGAFAMILIGSRIPPWVVILGDENRRPEQQVYDLHVERILVAKYDFILNPFATFDEKDRPSPTFLGKIRTTLKNATQRDLPSVQEKIDIYKASIKKSGKNGQIVEDAAKEMWMQNTDK